MNTDQHTTFVDPKQPPKSKFRFFNKMVLLFNYFAAIALLVSYLAAYVSPENFWVVSFLGLMYPLLFFINVLFVIYWAIQLKKQLFYSLVIILLGINEINHSIQFTFNKEANLMDTTINVMSYNVKLFDLYNWTKNIETRNKMFKFIDMESPNIACFQEYFHRDSSEFSNTDSILKIAKFKYYHIEYTSSIRPNQHFGIATFTTYPIINKGRINFGYKSNNICIYSDLIVANDTVRVYNMHLQSIAFSNDDYKYMDDLQKDLDAKDDVKHSKNILKRIKKAFIKRAHQVDLIEASIALSPYPVIVCGDFNDTPSSYSYNTISENLNDAFVESGTGLGGTYSGIGLLPSFRIDYILYSDKFQSYNFRTIREKMSDHFPIVASLSKK